MAQDRWSERRKNSLPAAKWYIPRVSARRERFAIALWCVCLSFGALDFAGIGAVHASGPAVTIEGGPDGLGTTYHWTVSNSHKSPIIRIEIPQYRGSLFFAPNGWTSTCTNLVAIGAPDEPGKCIASAASPSEGVAPGRSTTLGLQLANGAVKRGAGEAVITFADSTTVKIGGVLVPVPESFGDRYIPLIGLGAILAVFVLVQVVRGRKKSRNHVDA